MEQEFDNLDDGQLLAVIDGALDALNRDRPGLPTDREQLDLLTSGLKLEGRLRTWNSRLAARIDRDEVAWREHGTSAPTWLLEANLTRRESGRLIAAGRHLHRFGRVAEAAETGAVSPTQAEAIASVLDQLPEEFDPAQTDEAQRMMVTFAESHTATELRQLTGHLVEVLDPVSAEEREAKRIEREHRRAQRDRHLTFTHTHDGSVLIRGSLPVAEGEAFIKLVDAHTAAVQRGLDAVDPEAEYVSSGMRRADGLIAMIHAHQQQKLAPACGGDRPRVVVTIDYDRLHAMAVGAGYPVGRLTGSNQAVAASVLRRWLCDADIIPMVLGGDSEILDVGRAQRLVTPAIRRALEIRDGGCVFPGCDKPPDACHAHHIIPWWAHGPTALHNLVLVCPHHHGIVEPSRDAAADRWRVTLDDGHIARVIPPRRVDPDLRPRTHTRFRTKTRKPAGRGHPGAPGPPGPGPQAA